MEFRNVRDKCLEIWNELEILPSDAMGKQLYDGNVSKFIFSEDNMCKLEVFFRKVSELK